MAYYSIQHLADQQGQACYSPNPADCEKARAMWIARAESSLAAEKHDWKSRRLETFFKDPLSRTKWHMARIQRHLAMLNGARNAVVVQVKP